MFTFVFVNLPVFIPFPQCSEAQKLLNIAKELLHTEEAYVKRLNLLDQVTHGHTLSVSGGGVFGYRQLRLDLNFVTLIRLGYWKLRKHNLMIVGYFCVYVSDIYTGPITSVFGCSDSFTMRMFFSRESLS